MAMLELELELELVLVLVLGDKKAGLNTPCKALPRFIRALEPSRLIATFSYF